jgi:hypothetical protein
MLYDAKSAGAVAYVKLAEEMRLRENDALVMS